MLIIHFPESNKTIELSRRDVAAHLAKGSAISRFKLFQEQLIIETKLGKSYIVESINDYNHEKMISMWQQHKEHPAYLFLSDDAEKAKLSNYNGLEVFCSVRERGK